MKRIIKISIHFYMFLLLASTAIAGENKWFDYKIGLDERFRYEFQKDLDFDKSKHDNGGQFFHRFRLNLKTTFKNAQDKELFSVFTEGLDAQTGGYQKKASTTQVDDFDLHQAYLTIPRLFSDQFSAKAGRMELNYGAGRLISAPAWSNRMRHFDAGVLMYKNAGLSGDLIYAQDVKYDDNNFNRSLDEELIGGTYWSYQKDKARPLSEGYFLTQIITTGATATERYTVGGRWQGKIPGDMLLDVELPYQFGTVSAKKIKAHAFHADVTKDVKEWVWQPKFNLEYNHATGDDDLSDSVNNTFNPLYQSTHSPYGLLDYFRWQNMREVAANVTLSPIEKFKIIPQVNFFWLESKFDSWVNSSGTVVRAKTSGERGYYVGNEASLRFRYEFNKYVKSELGYAHFFAGGYLKDSGADDAVDWVYSEISLKY